MARRDILESVHEPFGDAFYYGPEILSDRFRNDTATREQSGFSQKTYKDVLNEVMDAGKDVSITSPPFSSWFMRSSELPELPVTPPPSRMRGTASQTRNMCHGQVFLSAAYA